VGNDRELARITHDGPVTAFALSKVVEAAKGKTKMALRALEIERFGDATEEERQALLDRTINKLLLAGPTIAGKVRRKARGVGRCRTTSRRALVSAHITCARPICA
jgi:hypothetical protein